MLREVFEPPFATAMMWSYSRRSRARYIATTLVSRRSAVDSEVRVQAMRMRVGVDLVATERQALRGQCERPGRAYPCVHVDLAVQGSRAWRWMLSRRERSRRTSSMSR